MKILAGTPFPLGVKIENHKVNFSVNAGECESCSLLLYRKNEETVLQEIEMSPAPMAERIYCVALPESEVKNLEYNFKIGKKVVIDPFVRILSGKKGWLSVEDSEHEVRGKIAGASFDWEGDVLPNIPDDEVIAYSLHVRGYTKNRMSRVRKKGTFAGISEKIPYFKELGVNQIQCMPLYEFGEWLKPESRYFPASRREDWKINYWGYGQGYFMAPKCAYAATKDPVRELKLLVKELHRNGIELVVNFPFSDGILPQDMIDCLRYWHMEYHLDGFIINPYVLPISMTAEDPVLKSCKILVLDEEFQNAARRFLKGDEGSLYDAKRMFSRIAGNHRYNTITTHTGFTLMDLVSYERKHNEENGENNRDGVDYNLSWNCGAEGPTRKKDVLALRRNQVRNAMAMLLISQGTPCILAGDEFLNSQSGNNNVYCQDNPVGWTDWNREAKNRDMIRYVQDLIAFRRKHPALRSPRILTGNDPKRSGIPDISFHGESAWQFRSDPTVRQFGILLGGEYADDDDIYLIFNMHWNEHDFALPALKKGKKWYREFTTDQGILREPECIEKEKTVSVHERTIEIFVGR